MTDFDHGDRSVVFTHGDRWVAFTQGDRMTDSHGSAV